MVGSNYYQLLLLIIIIKEILATSTILEVSRGQESLHEPDYFIIDSKYGYNMCSHFDAVHTRNLTVDGKSYIRCDCTRELRSLYSLDGNNNKAKCMKNDALKKKCFNEMVCNGDCRHFISKETSILFWSKHAINHVTCAFKSGYKISKWVGTSWSTFHRQDFDLKLSFNKECKLLNCKVKLSFEWKSSSSSPQSIIKNHYEGELFLIETFCGNAEKGCFLATASGTAAYNVRDPRDNPPEPTTSPRDDPTEPTASPSSDNSGVSVGVGTGSAIVIIIIIILVILMKHRKTRQDTVETSTENTTTTSVVSQQALEIKKPENRDPCSPPPPYTTLATPHVEGDYMDPDCLQAVAAPAYNGYANYGRD